MKTHSITVTVTAPNRLDEDAVASIIHRLIWIGKEDAERTFNQGEADDLQPALDAMSLHLKFGDKP